MNYLNVFSVLMSIVLVLLALLYYILKKKSNYWIDRNFPISNSKRSLLFGNYKGMSSVEHGALITQRLYSEFKERKELIGAVNLFVVPTVITIDLDIIKHVLVKDFNYFHDRGVFHNAETDPLSAHLFSLEGQKWRNLRAKLTPTFTSGKMKMMFGTILDVAVEFEKFMIEKCEHSTEVEVKDICGRFTTDVIGSCAFGIECNTLQNPDSEFRSMLKKVFDQPLSTLIWTIMLMMFSTISKKLGLKITNTAVEKFFMKICREIVDFRMSSSVQRNDFMNLLIELKKKEESMAESEKNLEPLTFNELAAQCFVFFLAGFETSSTAMTFCLYELAINTDIQTKLRDEINGAIDKSDGKITYENVLSIEYLDKVINETLRKYPPLDNVFRNATNDYKVPNTDFVIPKGTLVIVPVYSIQHDPEYYPEPEKFNPENFSTENIKSRPQFTHLPFGEGPRVCIGMRFGIMQMKIGLVTLLRKFRISPSEKTTIPVKLMPTSSTLAPEGGMHLAFERI